MKTPRMNAGARKFLDEMAVNAPARFHTMPATEARRIFNQRQGTLSLPPAHPCPSTDLTLAGSVPVRLYTPDQAAGAPVLVYFHGGGWTLGNLDTVDALCHDLCHLSGWAIVSVDYRLAPEHAYPAPLDDGRAVLEAIMSGDLGDRVDRTRIAVAGDSAGGTLAAVLALEGGDRLIGQVLLYPATDRSKKHPSMIELGSGLNLNAATMDWFWNNYVPDPALHDDWHVSPLCVETAGPLPAGLVVVAGHDPLADEGLAYAEHLAALGCRTEVLAFPDQIHGFATQTALGSSPFMLRDAVAGFLRRIARAAPSAPSLCAGTLAGTGRTRQSDGI